MNIFGIIGISFFVSLVISASLMLFLFGNDCKQKTYTVIPAIVLVALIVPFTFIGIEIATNDARVFVARFEAQKTTIEQSLSSDAITGLERIDLVNKAIELNGKLAEQKYKTKMWYCVLYDETIYDNVDFITFDQGGSDV